MATAKASSAFSVLFIWKNQVSGLTFLGLLLSLDTVSLVTRLPYNATAILRLKKFRVLTLISGILISY